MTNDNCWQGARVRLRAVEPEDWEQHFEWDKNTESARMSYRMGFPQSREATMQWAREQALKPADGDKVRLQIETLNGEFVGTLNVHHSEPRDGTFSYGLAIMPQQRRKGYASEAIQLVLRFYFEELRYQKCTIQVYSFNTSSMQLHERCGFQLEGRVRRMVYSGGTYHDELYYGITAEEFAAQVRE